MNKENHFQKKLCQEWTMNRLWKQFRKKSNPKNRKNSDPKNRKNPKKWKNQSEISAWKQKTTHEKENFCSNSIFSFYFKIKAKKNSRQKNHSLFRSISCFDVTKTTAPIWLQKSWKCVNTFWKKNIAGRIPKTTRSGNTFKRHPTTRQLKRFTTNLWSSWNKTEKK